MNGNINAATLEGSASGKARRRTSSAAQRVKMVAKTAPGTRSGPEEVRERSCNGASIDAQGGRRRWRKRDSKRQDAMVKLELYKDVYAVMYIFVPKGIVGQGSASMIQAGIGTEGHTDFGAVQMTVGMTCIGMRTVEMPAHPVHGIMVDTALPRGSEGIVVGPRLGVVGLVRVMVVTLTSRLVNGVSGGPANALRRLILLLLGELVSGERRGHVEAAMRTGAELAHAPTLNQAALAPTPGGHRRPLAKRGLCPGSAGPTGCTYRTSSMRPTLPRSQLLHWTGCAKGRKGLLVSTSIRDALTEAGRERVVATVVPLARARLRCQTSDNLAEEDIATREPRSTLGEMQSIQFVGECTRLGQLLRRGRELPMLVRKFGGSDLSLGRRLRGGRVLPMLEREFGGSAPSLGTVWTERGGRRRSACRRATLIFKFPSATTPIVWPSEKSARGGRMRGQDQLRRNESAR